LTGKAFLVSLRKLLCRVSNDLWVIYKRSF
jgi:hypothetical protein